MLYVQHFGIKKSFFKTIHMAIQFLRHFTSLKSFRDQSTHLFGLQNFSVTETTYKNHVNATHNFLLILSGHVYQHWKRM